MGRATGRALAPARERGDGTRVALGPVTLGARRRAARATRQQGGSRHVRVEVGRRISRPRKELRHPAGRQPRSHRDRAGRRVRTRLGRLETLLVGMAHRLVRGPRPRARLSRLRRHLHRSRHRQHEVRLGCHTPAMSVSRSTTRAQASSTAAGATASSRTAKPSTTWSSYRAERRWVERRCEPAGGCPAPGASPPRGASGNDLDLDGTAALEFLRVATHRCAVGFDDASRNSAAIARASTSAMRVTSRCTMPPLAGPRAYSGGFDWTRWTSPVEGGFVGLFDRLAHVGAAPPRRHARRQPPARGARPPLRRAARRGWGFRLGRERAGGRSSQPERRHSAFAATTPLIG